MKKRIASYLGVICISMIFAATATAETFWKTGTITRTWNDNVYYSGCLVLLSVPMGNGCPKDGWFSLDCKGEIYGDAENSRRLFAAAMAAGQAGNTVTVAIDNTKKVNGYCTARVLQVFY